MPAPTRTPLVALPTTPPGILPDTTPGGTAVPGPTDAAAFPVVTAAQEPAPAVTAPAVLDNARTLDRARRTLRTEASAAAARKDPPELGRRKLAESFTPPEDGKVKVAFFDADSTLRVSLSGAVSANGPKDVRLLPGVAAKLKELAAQGYLVAIVSNQEGVRFGHVTLLDADLALAYTGDLIRARGGEVHYYDFAEGKNGDRKPALGMANRLGALLGVKFGARIDKANSLMVGDSSWKKGEPRPDGRDVARFGNSDRLFAEALGVAFHEPADFFGWRAFGIDAFDAATEVEAFVKNHGDF